MASTGRLETVNSELFVLTYGAIVTQLLRDYEDPKEVNIQLEQMGYNIGIRIIDEFVSKARGSSSTKCRNFKETIETLAKDAFKMFLGYSANVDSWNSDNTSCIVKVVDNPLSEFVELPPSISELRYSNIICGVIRGALEMLSMRIEAKMVKDALNGDECIGCEIRVTLKESLAEGAGVAYRDD